MNADPLIDLKARAAFYRTEAAAYRRVNGDARVIRWLEQEADRLEAEPKPSRAKVI